MNSRELADETILAQFVDLVIPGLDSGDVYTDAGRAIEEVIKRGGELCSPSPCGHKFADGTPHPMACWKEEYGVPTYATSGLPHATIPMIRHCLICDSEAKLRDEMERQFEIADSLIREERKQLRAELTALREFVRGVSVARVMKSYDAGDCIVAEFKEEAIAILTPPAASGRESEEGQK